jgi:hypothetical protein
MLIFICLDRPDGARPENLDTVDAEIRGLATRTEHAMTSLWLIDTTLSVDAVAEKLNPYAINSANRLLVGPLVGRTNGILPRDLWPWINGQATS